MDILNLIIGGAVFIAFALIVVLYVLVNSKSPREQVERQYRRTDNPEEPTFTAPVRKHPKRRKDDQNIWTS